MAGTALLTTIGFGGVLAADWGRFLTMNGPFWGPLAVAVRGVCAVALAGKGLVFGAGPEAGARVALTTLPPGFDATEALTGLAAT